MSDVRLLKCKFVLEALHELQTCCACRRRACLHGQCQLCLNHKVADVLAEVACDPLNYTCANGDCSN